MVGPLFEPVFSPLSLCLPPFMSLCPGGFIQPGRRFDFVFPLGEGGNGVQNRATGGVERVNQHIGCEKSLFREILLLWAENAELNFKAVCGFIRRDRRRACMGPKLTF